MPNFETIDDALEQASLIYAIEGKDYADPIRLLIRAAVEKAMERARLEAKIEALEGLLDASIGWPGAPTDGMVRDDLDALRAALAALSKAEVKP